MTINAPLEGLLVLEFAQFLAGPLCGLRLADLGARVIKIERPNSGDLGRQIYLSETNVGGVNTLFQAINRNKESFAANLKDPADKTQIDDLIAKADVVIQNFRPGVFDRLGFSYDAVSKINPEIIYASVTGYGTEGPWVDLPGQDLLAQARSGVMWLNGQGGQPPQPVGLAVADMLAGHNLTQAVLAGLVRRGIKGQGAKVETSLLESLIDFQFEVLTTHLNDGNKIPERSKKNGSHAYLPSPYGVYATKDKFIAIAMTPIEQLMKLMGIDNASSYNEPSMAFSQRDEINQMLADHFKKRTTQEWLDILQPHDIWCAEVLSWDDLLVSKGFLALEMIQSLKLPDGATVQTTRSPLRIDGALLLSDCRAPTVGQHTESIIRDYAL